MKFGMCSLVKAVFLKEAAAEPGEVTDSVPQVGLAARRAHGHGQIQESQGFRV